MTPRFSPPANLTPYQGFIFDCDGTLIDSMPAHYLAWRKALRAAGASFDFTWQEYLSRAGMSLRQTAEELALKFNCVLDVELLARVKAEEYTLQEQSILPIPEVVEFARSLHGRFPLAVATGSRRFDVERTLTRLGLVSLFSIIVTPADVAHGKPEPEMFLLAARHLGVAPERCLVLEDGESGFEAARRAHMDFSIVLPALMPTLPAVS